MAVNGDVRLNDGDLAVEIAIRKKAGHRLVVVPAPSSPDWRIALKIL